MFTKGMQLKSMAHSQSQFLKSQMVQKPSEYQEDEYSLNTNDAKGQDPVELASPS